jgi:hypothetical protein
MTIKIRSGDLEGDRQTAVALLSRYVNPAYDGRRFEWLYRRNPAGAGRLWIAEDGSSGEPVGTAGAFPRRVYVQGVEAVAWVLGDFCVTERHRALGPALQLQRACLDDLAAEGIPFCYDFPARSMEAVYRRLGIGPYGQLVRLARPLRVRRKLQQRWGDSLPVRLAAAVADVGLAYRIRHPRAPVGLEISPHTGPCGDEFSALARGAASRYGLCVARSADYMDWRYRDNPIQSHQILAARFDGGLAAYAVLTREGESATIVDLFGVADPAVILALVGQALAILWEQGCSTVSTSLPSWHPVGRWLRRLGFRPRETAAVTLYAPPGSSLGARVIHRGDWFLTDGDRDS